MTTLNFVPYDVMPPKTKARLGNNPFVSTSLKEGDKVPQKSIL